MADAESKQEQPAPVAPPARPGGGKLVPVLLGVNTVALLAVAALMAVQVLRPAAARHPAPADEQAAAAPRDAPEKPEQKEKAKESPPGPTLRLADFVVHLRDPDADRYARVSFELELSDEKAREALTARVPQVRDAFLAYLSDCNTEELRGSEAITRVKAALSGKLAQVAPRGAVRGLYVTELVVQ